MHETEALKHSTARNSKPRIEGTGRGKVYLQDASSHFIKGSGITGPAQTYRLQCQHWNRIQAKE